MNFKNNYYICKLKIRKHARRTRKELRKTF